MTENTLPVDDLPGDWQTRPCEHPEVPSSDPIATCVADTSPPFEVYEVRMNVRLRFGVGVRIYEVHGEYHIYPQTPMEADDVLLHVHERSPDASIQFGNRTQRIHLHGNTTSEIKAGQVHNDAIGLMIHRADGSVDVVTGESSSDSAG
jgi:hypothetical protein